VDSQAADSPDQCFCISLATKDIFPLSDANANA